jgi:hypothetical protein
MRKQVVLALLLVAATVATAGAQTFSSGSTGADGALNITANPQTNVTTLPLPPSGILNFTTVNVAAGCTLTFAKNASNTPVVMLATGDVQINGVIDVNAGGTTIDNNYDSRVPGPGGFAGGGPGAPGMGPGGGTPNDDPNIRMGKWLGPLSLVPIVGGSGGADSGGGGGGAIVIASSGKIAINGAIYADGVALGGSGGAIRLVANRVELNNGVLYALGCWTCGYNQGHNGSVGLIRIEAPTGQTLITAPDNISPLPVITVPNAETNPLAWRPELSTLSIVSVAGQPVPPGSGSRPYAADILLPVTIPDDVPVVVGASNIPLDTEITLGFLSTHQGTVTTARLAGSLASSTATLHLTGLSRATGVVTSFYVAAVFAVAPFSGGGTGPDAVAKVRLTASLGAPMRTAYLRADGTEVDAARVPAALRARFTR